MEVARSPASLAYRTGRTFTDESVTMLDPRKLFGQAGESAAEEYLRHKGYRIVARNLRSPRGELDLVAEDGHVLVFVEVKARRTDSFGGAIHAVHQRKQEKLIQLAAQYLARHHIKNRLCRFDVVLLQGTDAVAPQIEHIQNAFEVSGDDLRW
ncbi:MAG: YraN family protein [Nitrospiraceae bacterium]